jgi:hypothetical protein
MHNVSRKSFIQTLTLGGGSLLTVGLGDQAEAQQTASSASQTVNLKSDAFVLTLSSTPTGLKAHLVHVRTNTILADGDYSYDFGPVTLSIEANDDSSAIFKGTTDTGLELTHAFRLPSGSPWLEEEISIKNTTATLIDDAFRCGFVLPVTPDTMKGYSFTAIPFRREPRDSSHGYQDFAFTDVVSLKRHSTLREDSNPVRLYDDYLSEGWALTDGSNGFVFSRYNQHARDFLILDRVVLAGGQTGLRWGGGGTSVSDCEGLCQIAPGATRSFGTSRLSAYQGDLTQGYYIFRAEMDSRGMSVPANYNPPVHWNELYDNKLWYTTDPGGQENPVNRKKYYTLDALKIEAAKAKAIGCEALYCDPGWDTYYGEKIWDESRLGKVTDFVAMLKNDYGLKLSLHAPLGSSHPTYRPECFRMNRDGSPTGVLCVASKQYADETVKRLDVLAAAGVVFFMFDGTYYNCSPDCWDPTHGHALPLNCSDHVNAINLLACRVHETYPDVSIEMHDQAMDGAPFRYVPLYYGYGRNVFGTSPARGFDTIWALEMMWDPLGNLVQGQSILFYYYNLSYSLPFYLHIDLRSDNENAVAFWWNASTIRYLGIGGTSQDPKINAAHAAAMKDYLRLKPFFAAGTFYGICECIHVHKHPTDNAAVMNVFNIPGAAQNVSTITFDPANFGLKPDKTYKFSAGNFTKNGAAYTGTVFTTDMGHTLVEIIEA